MVIPDRSSKTNGARRSTVGPAGLVVLAFAVLCPAAADAVPLPDPTPPDTSVIVPLGGTTVAARPELAGTVLEEETFDYGYTDDGLTAYYGKVRHRVIRSDIDGTLDFYWRVIPERNPLGTHVADGYIRILRVFELGGIDKDADWRSDGEGNKAPINARHFDNGTVNFRFEDSVLMPTDNSSYWFFLDTQATSYSDTGLFGLIGFGGSNPSGDSSDFFPAFVPVIPEPTSAALLVLAGILRGRRPKSGA
jgi:hypothetical protein